MHSRSPTVICFYCADQNPHRDRSLGITSYTRGLLSNLAATGRFQLQAVTSKSSAAMPPAVAAEVLPFRTDTAAGRLAGDHLHPILAGSRGQLWHYPKGFLPLVARVRAPIVSTVHDTILQHYANNYAETRSRADFAYWLLLTRRSIARADAVLTVSEFSRTSILEFCARHRIKAPPIHVTYQGVNIELPSEPVAKGEYVLHLASALPHKRTRWLCKSWRELQEAGRSLPPLLLLGALDEETGALAKKLRHAQSRPHVGAAELPEIMARARALLLPSEIEGFGLPAVEAYLTGTPVVYVAGTAVEEVLGQGTPGAFAFTAESFEHGLNNALAMTPAAVNAVATDLQQRFGWDRCVAKTIEVYEQLA